MFKNHEVFIEKRNLKSAIDLGKISSTSKSLRNMINRLLESLFSREHMATHTVSGRKAPVPSKKIGETKSMLSSDATKCLVGKLILIQLNTHTMYFHYSFNLEFSIWFWSKHHKVTIGEDSVREAIRRKLTTEHREFYRRKHEENDSSEDVAERSRQSLLVAGNDEDLEDNTD